jgi:class 3 adenylate cyclase
MSLSENVVLQTEIICEFLTGNRAHARADRVMQVLLFVDVVASTERALARGDVDWRADVEAFRRAVEGHVERFGARLVNTRGDDLFIACPSASPAVELALEIRDRAAELQLEVRAGLHVAEVEDTGDDFLGMGVHVAARVCEVAAPGEIWVTEGLRSAVLGGSTRFDDRHAHELKGIPGAWQLSAVVEPDVQD